METHRYRDVEMETHRYRDIQRWGHIDTGMYRDGDT